MTLFLIAACLSIACDGIHLLSKTARLLCLAVFQACTLRGSRAGENPVFIRMNRGCCGLSIRTTNEDRVAVMPPMELHGRRQIFTNEQEITPGNILKVLNDALAIHARNRSEEKYLTRYLRGIQPILDRV